MRDNEGASGHRVYKNSNFYSRLPMYFVDLEEMIASPPSLSFSICKMVAGKMYLRSLPVLKP